MAKIFKGKNEKSLDIGTFRGRLTGVSLKQTKMLKGKEFMPKITFMGAGSTVFAKNVLGDCMCRESLRDSEIALYDINAERLKESKALLDNLNKSINEGRAKLKKFLGV